MGNPGGTAWSHRAAVVGILARQPTRIPAVPHPCPSHTLSVAPMLDWTDRHARFLLRLISRHTRLYTEMVTTGALLHGHPARWLDYDPAEHPLALQLGGADPQALAACTRLATTWGYDEVNLNAGCPSDRVSAGRFGACLMAEPALVADCVQAMQAETPHPVSVKTRLGIDDQDSDDFLYRFLDAVAAAGCRTIILHARKAWLQGLSPKENREIPPLQYARVHAAKQRYPELTIVLNGGIRSLDEARAQLAHVDGVMIGRAAYETPWLLADADHRLFGDAGPSPERFAVLAAYCAYMQRQLLQGVALHHMSRHVLGLFQGQPGARRFRRHISEHAHRHGAGLAVIEDAVAAMLSAAADAQAG